MPNFQQPRTPRRANALRALIAAVLLVPALAQARPFRAGALFEDSQSLLRNYSVTAGLFFAGGAGEVSGWRTDHPATPMGMGFRYHERNGFITGTIMAIAQIVAGAAAASGPKSSETWEEGNYRYTRTTYYSAAERQAITASASSSAARMFSSPNQSFDLEIYSRNLGGDISGYRATMMILGFDVLDTSMIDLGLGFGSAMAAVAQDGRYLIADWTYFGMPFRLNIPVGPLLLWAQFDWNWFGHTRGGKAEKKVNHVLGSTHEIGTAGFPLRIGASAALLQRLYLEAVVLTPSVLSGDVAFTASAGARF